MSQTKEVESVKEVERSESDVRVDEQYQNSDAD